MCGIFQYDARRETPSEKPSMPNKPFIIGRISPEDNKFIGINWVKRPSNSPEFSGIPCFKYFQSWSPNRKCVPWYRNIRFKIIKEIKAESQKQESVDFKKRFMVATTSKLSIFLYNFTMNLC